MNLAPKHLAASFVAMMLLAAAGAASAQQLDLSQGGPVTVTARGGIDWHQNEKQVIAHGDARAVRGTVTVDADRLIAFYRKKADASGAAPAAPPAGPAPAPAATGAADADTGGTEIYRLEAVGNVRIYTQTDQAQGDRAVYDMDQAVMVLTGSDLKLTTPNEVLTARDAMEYWPQKHMAVARGNAVVVTKDARRMAADTLVAYTTDQDKSAPQGNGAPGAATQVAAKAPAPGGQPSDDPLTQSGKLQKVEAYGHVSVRTPTDTVTGDRAVYVPDTGIARIFGNVRITRGENQLNGSEAEVNQKTGISRLLAGQSERVQGLVVPNDSSSQNAAPAGQAPAGQAPAKPPGKQPGKGAP
jgi:lipopolysaccharide export system protein LptA